MALNIGAVCSTFYRAVHNSGPRNASDIKYIVIHSTEGPTAEGAASWFTNPKSGGSANLVVDDNGCYRTVDDLVIPWAAPPLNKSAFHIEQAGYTHWTRDEWLAHRATIRRCAWKAAQRALLFKIPIRQVGWLGLKLGRKGITSHRAVSLAFHQSDHTDPGTGYPWDVFMAYVKQYAAEQSL
jgi:N-acetyl-anhydromuramyl-L-alanine amidase AmpD